MPLSVVLDTNVLLVSFSRHSPYNWIFQALADQRYTLCLTTEIALEYLEVVGRHNGSEVADRLAFFLKNAASVRWVDIYYRWHLIDADPDDNKFVDCVIAADADFLVTEDQHFKVLESIPFPSVSVLDVEGFQQVLDSTT